MLVAGEVWKLIDLSANQDIMNHTLKNWRDEMIQTAVYTHYLGDGLYAYVIQTESGFDVYETKYSNTDDFLESFDTLEEAKKYTDFL